MRASVRAAAASLAVAALVAGAATVAAGPWVEPDPAILVGRWTGKATWRRCAVDGAARVSLVVERDGGGYRVDLGGALDGLGPELLAPVGAVELEATHDDLRVRWLAGKPGRATVRLGFASGCEGTLALVRESTGAPACDELIALRAIAGRCPDLPPPATAPADVGARLAARPRGKALAAVVATCRREAPPLRASLVAAGCVPAPIDPSLATTRVPECDALIATVDRLMRCNRVPVEARQRLRVSMGRVDRWGAVDADDPDARARAAQTCDETRAELESTMAVLGCL